ncbi:MAG: transcriptional repressor LexA [Lachnospiraceae bacterium]|nr:transcriptional repressor LexA [Candidatus Minthocola equi]
MPRERSDEMEQAILEFIKTEILSKGYPPSIREICEAVGLKSTSSVHAYLNVLEEKGLIERRDAKNRAITITDDEFNLTGREMIHIPVIGQVAAGSPILAEQNIEDYFSMPAGMLPPTGGADVFMLNVHGDSMIDMGIYDGDKVICRQTSTARNGEVVVALVDDSATVKRFYKEDGYYRLQPENTSMDPIIVDHCDVLGSVVGLVRFNIH